MYQNIFSKIKHKIRIMVFKTRMLSSTYEKEVNLLVASLEAIRIDYSSASEIAAEVRFAGDGYVEPSEYYVAPCVNCLPAHLQAAIQAALSNANQYDDNHTALCRLGDAAVRADPAYTYVIAGDSTQLWVGKIADMRRVYPAEIERNSRLYEELRGKLLALHADVVLRSS